MNKKDAQKRILQNGKPLALSTFSWNAKTRTLTTCERYLVIDFDGISDCTFKTGYGCTFKTGRDCTFKTGGGCTFKTGGGCTFTTGYGCTFKTGRDCTFKTGDDCTFTTGGDCKWKHSWGETAYPLLHFCGSRYEMECVGPNKIRSGCIAKNVAWWQTNVRRCAEEHGYTPQEQNEYAVYVELISTWMAKVGLLDSSPSKQPEPSGE